ncbi:MAG: response regulator transcription factor [bacterium]
MSIRLLIADDHKIVCLGLKTLLEKETDIKVIAEADNGRSAVKLCLDLLPDAVIMDISMPELNGIDAARQIIAKTPHVKVLILSIHMDKHFVAEALRAGVSGYVLKDSAFEELKTAIHTVLSGHVYLSPAITGVVVKDYVNSLIQNQNTISSMLTEREREVLQLLAEGQPTKQIALKLGVSVKTIETFRSNIMEKLDIHSIAEITKYAIREGLTTV